jgi:hypothetical protein
MHLSLIIINDAAEPTGLFWEASNAFFTETGLLVPLTGHLINDHWPTWY